MAPPILLYFTFALTISMAYAETSAIEARIHKLPFGILLWPAGFLHPEFSPAGYSSQGYSSQGFSSPGNSPPGFSGPVALRREQTLEGGRYLQDPAMSREHNIKKRNIATPIFHRKIRSTDTDDNCKRKLICELHAKARRNPTYAYELYFIRKKGLAKYWNHEDIKYDDCKKRYPCQNSKTSDTKARARDDYNDDYYNTDYETEYTSADYGSYDNAQYS
ncbi:uncharacterized protein LOC143919471 isoform X2 [Arctopsyche grandis]|uniref:uncharacterized protein LOC143919471 isoform X2 n=1 Tax=Arctopsyche grandis TaxID=121162 RepID=UPI00406D774D